MTKVLRATEAQKEALEGMAFSRGAIAFVQDASGDWVTPIENRTNERYRAAWDALAELEEIPYNPAPPPE